MCKDRSMFALILGIMLVVLFITVDVFADVEYADIPEKAGLGKFDGTGITFFGDFKDCATDAFFYLMPVNESDEEITVVLPARVYVEGSWHKVDHSAYMYKDLGENRVPESFADAKSGTPLDLGIDYSLTLPAHSAYSIMGRIKDVPRDYFSRMHTSDDDMIYAYARVTINNAPMTAEGYLNDEGSVCASIMEVPIAGENFIYGFYRVSESETDVCSMAFYFLIENLDERYSTVVELPHWVEIDGNRWNIGCDLVSDECLVSGFRHFAYADLDESGVINDSRFVFCDKDYAQGDHCFRDDDLWWLEVPAGKAVMVRSMVNDFCSAQNDYGNPLVNTHIDMQLLLSDSGNNQRMIGGQIFGNVKGVSFIGVDPDSMISSEEGADPIRETKSADSYLMTEAADGVDESLETESLDTESAESESKDAAGNNGSVQKNLYFFPLN